MNTLWVPGTFVSVIFKCLGSCCWVWDDFIAVQSLHHSWHKNCCEYQKHLWVPVKCLGRPCVITIDVIHIGFMGTIFLHRQLRVVLVNTTMLRVDFFFWRLKSLEATELRPAAKSHNYGDSVMLSLLSSFHGPFYLSFRMFWSLWFRVLMLCVSEDNNQQS